MTLNGRVPVAVVGAGNMGLHHARNYDALAHADLRAVVDPDGERAERVAARFGCAAYTMLDDLLASEPAVAAASVAVPTSLHHEVASRLIAAGKHVLVEKPIAASVEEANDLVARADEAAVVLAAGHVERFNPAVRALKERIEARAMGDVLSLVARRVGVFPAHGKDANVILDLAIHDVDVFRYLLDVERPDEIFCNAGKARNGDLYDFADVFLRFGPVGCLLQVNWLTPVKIRSLAVTGTRGYGELEYVTQRLDFYGAQTIEATESFAQVARYSAAAPERVGVVGDEPLRRELDGFLRAVTGEDGEVVSGRDATRSLAVVAAIIDEVDGRRG
jgi:UDP-N-acetylglucosamine 3-dehydrogenase